MIPLQKDLHSFIPLCQEASLCENSMGWNKQIGIKAFVSVSTADRAEYIRGEEEAQCKSKRSKGFVESSPPSHHAQRSPSTSTHGSGYGGTLDIGTNISLRSRR